MVYTQRVMNLKNGFRIIGRAGSEWSEGVEGLEEYRVV